MLPHPPRRVLALDLGTRRIGMAVSDAMGWTAQGLETLQRRNLRMDIGRLKRVAAQWEVGLIVVGNPKQMSGEEGRQSQWAREFATELERRLSLPVVLWDERLTSAQAERLLREGGATTGKRARVVDQMAAVILLQSFLDAHAAEEAPVEGESAAEDEE